MRKDREGPRGPRDKLPLGPRVCSQEQGRSGHTGSRVNARGLPVPRAWPAAHVGWKDWWPQGSGPCRLMGSGYLAGRWVSPQGQMGNVPGCQGLCNFLGRTGLPLPHCGVTTADPPQDSRGAGTWRGAPGSVSFECSRKGVLFHPHRLVQVQRLGDHLRHLLSGRSREFIYFQVTSIPSLTQRPGRGRSPGPLSLCSSCGAGSPSGGRP